MAPRALLLDVMGTLVHDPFHVEMPAFFGLSLRELIAQKHPDAWVRFERGAIDERALLEGFFADRRAFDHGAFARAVKDAYRYLPGVEPLLAELRDRGVAMHTLSNYPCWYRWIEERVALSRYVRWSFVSCESGHRKPEPAAYLHASAALGAAPAECLFIDDRDVNCDAARAVGMESVRFESAEQLRAELRARGVLG